MLKRIQDMAIETLRLHKNFSSQFSPVCTWCGPIVGIECWTESCQEVVFQGKLRGQDVSWLHKRQWLWLYSAFRDVCNDCVWCFVLNLLRATWQVIFLKPKRAQSSENSSGWRANEVVASESNLQATGWQQYGPCEGCSRNRLLMFAAPEWQIERLLLRSAEGLPASYRHSLAHFFFRSIRYKRFNFETSAPGLPGYYLCWHNFWYLAPT